MARPRQKLLFVDIETTGLDADKHEIIEVATILTSFDGQTVVDRWEQKVLAERPQEAELQALLINGYSEDQWIKAGAVSQATLATAIEPRLENATFVGQNVSFDEGFLRALFRRFNLKPNWDYHKVDTAVLSWPFFVTNPDLKGVSLKYMAPFLGVEPEPAIHRAAAGAETCRRVYVTLMARYAVL